MPASREIIEKAHNIYAFGTGDPKTQIKALAEAIVELDKHQTKIEEALSALLVKFNQTVSKPG